MFLPFKMAVVAAFFVGLSSGFVLMRGWVFAKADQPITHQIVWYVFVNALALGQTLLISAYVAAWLSKVVDVRAAQALAHGLGIVVPAGTSFVGHKFGTFTTRASRTE
jgi:putative flippase GtrA